MSENQLTKNLLINPGFVKPRSGVVVIRCYTPLNPDGMPWYETPYYTNVVAPDGWTPWLEHSTEFRPPWDTDNTQGRLPFESKLTEIKPDGSPQYPDRWHAGDRSWVTFKTFAITLGGIYQQVPVTAGKSYRARVWGMGWNTGAEFNWNPLCSWGAECEPFAMPWSEIRAHYSGQQADSLEALKFAVGVDPTGGINPYANTVVWSPDWSIYNTWSEIVAPDVVAQAPTITFFIRGEARLRSQVNDRYFASPCLEALDVTPEPCKGLPREQYERTLILLPPGAGKEWIYATVDSGVWDAYRITISGSADDGGIGALDYRRVLAVNPQLWNGDLQAFYETYYPGVIYVPIEADSPDKLTEWLKAWLNPPPPPTNEGGVFPPGLHLNTGDSGASTYMKSLAQEVDAPCRLPSIKAYGVSDIMRTLKLFKDIDSRILTVGRLSKGCDPTINVEGPNLNGDLLAEARRIMNTSMCAWELHRAYVDVWEVINEQDPVGPDGHKRLAEFMLHCMDIADANGYKLGVESYPLGVPEWIEMLAVAETGLLSEAKKRGHYLALHEYAYPLDAHFGEAIPGRVARPDRGPLAFRYRWWEDTVGGKDLMPNVLLTEVNLAKDLRTVPAVEWNTQIRWYLEEVNKDAYVKAAHLFGWGSLGSAWQDFDIQYAGFAPTWYQIALDTCETENNYPEIKRYSQRDPVWSADRLLPSTRTIGGSGCAMTSACMQATQVESTLTPKTLNAWLGANGGYTADGNLYWKKVADRVDGMDFVAYHVFRDKMPADMTVVRRVLSKGPATIQVDFYPGGVLNTHFVLALYEKDGDIRCIDPWTGTDVWLMETYAAAGQSLQDVIFAIVEYNVTEPVQKVVRVGFNDHPGSGGTAAEWLRSNALKDGFIVRPIFIGGNGAALNFSADEAAGTRVIVNLRFSWSTDAGGAGTLPCPGSADWQKFIDAAVLTVNSSSGVWGWELFNEMNNPREWPNGCSLTAQAVAQAYNAIRVRVPGKRLAVGALDPFNALAGDPRDWLINIYNAISGAEFVAAHGYVRGPDPSLVGSTDKFADAPLQWQYLNYPLCITELLKSLPAAYKSLEVYVTEFNHLWKTVEGDWGWVKDQRAYDVVLAAHQAAIQHGFSGLPAYRWDGDDWHVYDNPYVLNAIKALLS